MRRRALVVSLLGLLLERVAGADPYPRYREPIVRELLRAQLPAAAPSCRGADPARLVSSRNWRAVDSEPAPWTVPPPSGFVAEREQLRIGGLRINWHDRPVQPGGRRSEWGTVIGSVPSPRTATHAVEIRADIPAQGAPSPRASALVALRGTALVVFGGQDRSGVRNDGGVFDFRIGRWRRLPTTGAPSARAYASAAWLGDRLLVWGGGAPSGRGAPPVPQGTVDYKRDGAMLDVAKGRWTRITEVGAPSARRNSVVRTSGSSFVLFGGHGEWEWPYEGGRAVDDLAIYRPAGDVWTLVRVPFWTQPFAMTIAALPGGWFAIYDADKGLFLLDPARAALHPVPLPLAGAAGRLRAKLFATCDGLALFGGEVMTDPGGGCENFEGPGGCDPVGPTYAKMTGGWHLTP
jgi:hypothetical protein